MNPTISSFREENNILKFTLSGVNFSFANAIRRNISSIPTVVFRTFPHDRNAATIRKNTTRFTNEILKQRLSCIPIHMEEFDKDQLKNMQLVVDVKNNTESIRIITTEYFKIRDKQNNTFISDIVVRSIFPPDKITNHFIDFIRLHPKYSENMESEELEMTCDFDIGTADEDGMFNIVSTCAYSNTPDEAQINAVLESKEHNDKDEIEQANWRLLNSQRIYVEDSFDFIIESVGVFSNKYILSTSVSTLKDKVNHTFDEASEIRDGGTTLDNSYTLYLYDDDYTVGKMIEYVLYSRHFNNEASSVNFCAYKKDHPHDEPSSVVIGFNRETSRDEVATILQQVKQEIIDTLNAINEGVLEWTPETYA
jgi:DNA-directed RNA polymerase subunit L